MSTTAPLPVPAPRRVRAYRLCLDFGTGVASEQWSAMTLHHPPVLEMLLRLGLASAALALLSVVALRAPEPRLRPGGA